MTFTDDRGTIQDILTEPIDAVTIITSKSGAIRGNHYHKETVQWIYVVSGEMEYITTGHVTRVPAGQTVVSSPHDHHAMRFLEDTTMIVMTRGPRSGEGYESDTFRLEVPLV